MSFYQFIEIMKLFRQVVYAESEEQAENLFYDLLEQFGTKYKALQSYLESLFGYKE